MVRKSINLGNYPLTNLQVKAEHSVPIGETMSNPEALDLCCGTGGWSDALAEVGYTVTGVDIVQHPLYHHHFVRADVRQVAIGCFGNPDIIVASPPCREFTIRELPWTRGLHTIPPDLSILEACLRIIHSLEPRLWVLENVRGMQKWYKPATARSGSHYLWGDVALIAASPRHHESTTGTRPDLRARIPYEMAIAIASVAWASCPKEGF